MAWENIEERLQKALNLKLAFPSGTVWLPDTHLTIDDWLASLAQTDEEFRELNIPRIRFLQNRWRVEKLVQLRWDKPLDRRSIWAMYVGTRMYILFSDGADYHVIAAIDPASSQALVRDVIGKILENRDFVPSHPTSIKSLHPDVVPAELAQAPAKVGTPGRKPSPEWRGFLSEIFVGWIGNWLTLPEMGFWHQEMPEEKKKRAA